MAEAEDRGLTPLARIVAHAAHAQEPGWFTTAPAPAIRKVLAKAGWSVDDVDLFEINEAFAVVVLATQRELGLPLEKINVRGGACAVGHPIGASGARIVVTLLAAMRQRGARRGVAAICIGGGEAAGGRRSRPCIETQANYPTSHRRLGRGPSRREAQQCSTTPIPTR